MDEAIQKNILAELRMIKKLLAQNILVGASQIAQIEKLDSLGFEPKEIGELLGTSANTVRVTLTRIRKNAQKEKKQ